MVKTIWIGLQRVVHFAARVRFMRELGDGASWLQWNGQNPVVALARDARTHSKSAAHQKRRVLTPLRVSWCIK